LGNLVVVLIKNCVTKKFLSGTEEICLSFHSYYPIAPLPSYLN